MSEQAKRSIIELRNELKQLKVELSIATDPADIQRLAQAAGAVKDEMTDLNEQINVFAAGSPFELAGKQLGEVKGALANLDFQKAADRAKSLATTVQGISFSTATKGLKDLGTTFMNVGKSLLTNPLFLIAAVIAAISFAIIKVLKDMGVFERVLDSVKAALEFAMFPLKLLIQGLEDLAMWFGIAGDAASDYAKISVESVDTAQNELNKANNKAIKELERQIKVRRARGEDTVDLEREVLQERIKIAKNDQDITEGAIARLEYAKEQGKTINEEDLQNLRKRFEEEQSAFIDAIADRDAFDSIAEANAKDRSKKEGERAEQDRLRKEQQRKQEAAALDAAEKQKLAAIQRFFDEERSLRRKLEDLQTNLIEDDLERRLKQSEIAEARQIEDLQRQNDIRIKALRDAGVDEETIKQKQLELDQDFQNVKTQIEKNGIAEREKLSDDYRKNELNRLLGYFDRVEEARQTDKQKAFNTYTDAMADLEEALSKELITQERYNELKLLAEKEFQDKISQLQDEAIKQQEDKDKARIDGIIKNIQDGIAVAQSGLNSLAAFSDALFAMEEQKYAGNAEEMERINKEKFEANKAFAIGQAIIQTASGVLQALFGSGVPFPYSIPLGVLAGAAGAVQIAAIASQKYRSSASGGGSTPKPSGPMAPNFNLVQPGGVMGPPAPPTPPTDETGGMAGKPMGGQDFVVKAYVTESDITSSQKKINKYEQLSQL